MDVIDDEDKALILLSSQHDESFETFAQTLIGGRTLLSYSEVNIALVNLELRRKVKKFLNITSVEVLTMRGRSPNQQGENLIDRNRDHDLATVV